LSLNPLAVTSFLCYFLIAGLYGPALLNLYPVKQDQNEACDGGYIRNQGQPPFQALFFSHAHHLPAVSPAVKLYI
jgi:hypothetical protein